MFFLGFEFWAEVDGEAWRYRVTRRLTMKG
jgi:hypothetical protein